MAEYIERKKAIEAFWDTFQDGGGRTLGSVDGFLRTMPAADVEPVRHGRWEEKPFLLGTSFFCSACGSNYGMPHEVYNYCPNCGAKMEWEADNG